jgi:hypothetical protein
MIGVLIIPTGIGCEIGGHAGDANPVAKLLAQCCETLIVHPNVVNASDINEMPENCWYVEGSILDRFLEGSIYLTRPLRPNRILVAVNSPVRADSINAVSAARATIGSYIEIVELKNPLTMVATMGSRGASGGVLGVEELVRQLEAYDFDALAVHTKIEVDRTAALHYYQYGGINPWGGVEAKASRLIADQLNKPVAHAPLEAAELGDPIMNLRRQEVVDSRIAPEVISTCYLHSVLKGLTWAPWPTTESLGSRSASYRDVGVMISPIGCVGKPHWACQKAKIPVIVVSENFTCLKEVAPENFLVVNNYWEAAGIMQAMNAGISGMSVRRPLAPTRVL